LLGPNLLAALFVCAAQIPVAAIKRRRPIPAPGILLNLESIRECIMTECASQMAKSTTVDCRPNERLLRTAATSRMNP
jgi:hypothetical protein